jgi:hypothetical protein
MLFPGVFTCQGHQPIHEDRRLFLHAWDPSPGSYLKKGRGVAQWQSTCLACTRPWVPSLAEGKKKKLLKKIAVVFHLKHGKMLNQPHFLRTTESQASAEVARSERIWRVADRNVQRGKGRAGPLGTPAQFQNCAQEGTQSCHSPLLLPTIPKTPLQVDQLCIGQPR